MRFVVDTSTWIKLLRRQTAVRARFELVLAAGDEIIVTPVAYFELLRGLEKRRDLDSIVFVKALWAELRYVETSRDVWDEAVRLWVLAVSRNEKREDADVLIAAFASNLHATVITENVRHFKVFGVNVESWSE